jgi:hypothetical protein
MDIKSKRAIVILALSVLINSVYADPQAGNESQDWQHKMLFDPSEQSRQREDSGFVMICDGKMDKTGEFIVEADDCYLALIEISVHASWG